MLELKNLSKTYTQNNHCVEVIKNLNLSVSEQEFIALVGPSGCGKTTLLKIIAGLLPATSGELILDEKKIVSPGRNRGLVFQQFTLFPWRTVRENISFGLDLQKLDTKKKTEIVNHYLGVTELKDFAEINHPTPRGGV